MKALMTGVALLILFVQFHVFQIDQDSYIRASESLKYLTEDCSAGGGQFMRKGLYSAGDFTFEIGKSEKEIRHLLIKNMDLTEDFSPNESSRWQGPIHYDVYYYDDRGVCIHTQDGSVKGQDVFSYGGMFHDPVTGYEKVIVAPTVVVTIQTGAIKHRSKWISWPSVVRSSAYENLDRK